MPTVMMLYENKIFILFFFFLSLFLKKIFLINFSESKGTYYIQNGVSQNCSLL